MAYKRFFYRNGKKLGPYYYESYRDENGKVKKRYLGTADPDGKPGENIKSDSYYKAEEKIKKGSSQSFEGKAGSKTNTFEGQENSNKVTPTGINIAILIFLLTALILMDILFIFFLI